MVNEAYQEVVFSILKHHVDRLVLQYDFPQSYQIPMMQLPIQLT